MIVYWSRMIYETLTADADALNLSLKEYLATYGAHVENGVIIVFTDPKKEMLFNMKYGQHI